MREYKIYKTDLWWGIYRKKYVGSIMMLQYLNWHNLWGTNKTNAKTFYDREDALSVLVVMKTKDEKKSD